MQCLRHSERFFVAISEVAVLYLLPEIMILNEEAVELHCMAYVRNDIKFDVCAYLKTLVLNVCLSKQSFY